MKWHSISEVAAIVNMSRQAVYKKLTKLSQEEKLRLKGNISKNGQILLSDEGIRLLFGLTDTDNQTVNQVDGSVNRDVVNSLQNQLKDKEKEVVRLSDILDNLCRQLDDERRLRGEERQRTDTILMKMTSDISSMQKALEYKKQDEVDVSSIIMAKQEEERKTADELNTLAKITDSKFEQLSQLLLQQQNDFKVFKSSLESTGTPWYKKIWNWMNQPISWNGKELEVQMDLGSDSKRDKPRTGLIRISDAKAA